MTVVLNEQLSQLTMLGIYAAMLLYAVAFVMVSMNLARAASEKASVASASGKLETASIVVMGIAAFLHGIGVIGRGIAARVDLEDPDLVIRSIRELVARAHRPLRYPISDDVVVRLVGRRQFDQFDPPVAPVASGLDEIARPFLIGEVEILIGFEDPVPLQQAEAAAKDPLVKKVHDSYMGFKAKFDRWSEISEEAYHIKVRG